MSNKGRIINPEGVALLKGFEGCKLTAYLCPAGVWTIGYGHTGDVFAGQKITQQEADNLLNKDLAVFEQGVDKLTSKYLTENQFSALVCFAYNVGLGNLKSSTLLKKVNLAEPEASKEFLRWNKAGGKELAGLTRRRKAEQVLFDTP